MEGLILKRITVNVKENLRNKVIYLNERRKPRIQVEIRKKPASFL